MVEKNTLVNLLLLGTGIMMLNIIIIIINGFGDDDETQRIKAGLCIAQETVLYTPAVWTSSRGWPIQPEAYYRTRFTCPATEFWRMSQ